MPYLLLFVSIAMAGAFVPFCLPAQSIHDLVPNNTATHTAVQNGSWFSGTTWNTGTVPGDAAIVWIPDRS